MKNKALLVGNGINKLGIKTSWVDLIEEIKRYFDLNPSIEENKEKPLPLAYEEIFLTAIKKRNAESDFKTAEEDLKSFIANEVNKIKENEIHEKIRNLGISDIMTTNYEFSLEGITPTTNGSLIKERKYSIFRKHIVNKVNFWHIHGDSLNPNSINLGYEHYCGQLQQMRNYVVSGTNYNSKKILKAPLTKRIKDNDINFQSWIDLFFTKNIYILGLSLSFVETDIWWLITYRSRLKYSTLASVQNTITYYIPEKNYKESKAKIDLLIANDIKVVSLKSTDKDYYQRILNDISASS